MAIEHNGVTYETDEEGYLANLSDWNVELAEIMAKEDGCDMSDNHWEVVNFLREYYEEYQICLLYTSPSPRDGATSRMPSSA